ncbi:MAG TPA: formyl transferase [Thermoleophilaceae bacterium]|nr:formyl transferase [Thermoleophilaceae bacterium]
MRVVLLSRFPRADVPAWKRRVASAVHEMGHEQMVLYSRCSVLDHARAGLEEYGLGMVGSYLKARTKSQEETPGESASEGTLAAWAEARGIPVARHDRLGDAEAIAALESFDPDLILLVGSDIVPASVLATPRIGTLNCHYGLLPRYRGMNVAEWAIYQDDPVGVTIHWVDPGIDTGAIAAREEIPLEPGDDLDAVRAKQQEKSAEMLVGVVRAVAEGDAQSLPQQPGEGRQYYRMHPVFREAVERKLREGRYRPAAPA